MKDISKCYRVWFDDGSALLCNATDTHNAKEIAKSLQDKDDERKIKEVKCLTTPLIS